MRPRARASARALLFLGVVAPASHRHSGARPALAGREPGISKYFALNISGFRVRLREGAQPPRNDERGTIRCPNIFSYLPLTASLSGLYSPPSCPTERGDRDRHVRGVGCGGRRRCGVTRFMGDVCLRAGRICASTATGKETADLGMERILDSVTDDQIETRSAYSLEAPFPSPWDFNSRSERSSRQSASNRKNTAGGTSGTRSAPPKVLMHYPCGRPHRIRPKGATGTRRSARPLNRGWECETRRRPRAANNGGDDACLKSTCCLEQWLFDIRRS
jgi:hypothetical protein